MNIFLYLFFSSIEWLALILLMFAMFKFRLQGYWGQVILTSAIMSLLSHFVFQVIEIRFLATTLQPPVIFLFLWQMFRIQIFYSGVMTIYGYMAYMALQTAVMLVATNFGISYESIVPNSLSLYVIQTFTILTTVIVLWLLHRFRIGYSFVPDYEYSPVILKGINFRLLLLTLVGYGWISVSYYITFSPITPTLLKLLVFIILGVLLYYAQKKENAND